MGKIIKLDDYRKGGVNYKYDVRRITRGEVSAQEICELEETLEQMFLAKAKREGFKVIAFLDDVMYEQSRALNRSFDALHVLINQEHKIIDLRPVVRYLGNLDEVKFYMKFKIYQACRWNKSS